MVFDGKSVDGDGKLLGVNVGEFLLSAAVLVQFIQHFVGNHFGTIAAEFFHSLGIRIEFEYTWKGNKKSECKFSNS